MFPPHTMYRHTNELSSTTDRPSLCQRPIPVVLGRSTCRRDRERERLKLSALVVTIVYVTSIDQIDDSFKKNLIRLKIES